MNCRWSIVLLLIAFPVIGLADERHDSIWSDQIASQPFDRQPFHQIKVPDWVRSTVGTTAAHAFPNDDVPLREEVVPIHDIKVTFGPQYRLSRVHLEPDGVNLETSQTSEGTTITVPRLDVHTMVVGELQRPK